ncbi:unnamed protein product [Dicrocoelium dendriticum]|nr:unnamed protein product [Dicrocoelium dendriticum]
MDANRSHCDKLPLILDTDNRRLSVSETNCDDSGQPIHNLSKRLERWAEHFERQFNRPELSDSSLASDRLALQAVLLDPPSGSEVEREIGL